jgi:hypothetical protein
MKTASKERCWMVEDFPEHVQTVRQELVALDRKNRWSRGAAFIVMFGAATWSGPAVDRVLATAGPFLRRPGLLRSVVGLSAAFGAVYQYGRLYDNMLVLCRSGARLSIIERMMNRPDVGGAAMLELCEQFCNEINASGMMRVTTTPPGV